MVWCRTFSEPVRAVLLKLLPFLPAAKQREAHFARLYGIWEGWVEEMQARGSVAEADDSMWACLARVRDPSTGVCLGLFVWCLTLACMMTACAHAGSWHMLDCV